MPEDFTFEPAEALAARNPIRQLGESEEYRAARQRLLVREYELRRQIESIAAERRALPPGAEVTKDYRFEGEEGEVSLADLFGGHDAVFVYSYMFGPQRKNPCPMCTGLMNALYLRVPAIRENLGIAFVARSPLARLVEAKRDLGMPDLPVYSDVLGDYTRDWVHPDDADIPGANVFRKDGDLIRHFYSVEMTESDPGQDPRNPPELDPLWHVLDISPAGRRPDWYPSLNLAGRR
jgi:predicted dithiol-disulfide oxidoreductase (DUF899 family)